MPACCIAKMPLGGIRGQLLVPHVRSWTRFSCFGRGRKGLVVWKRGARQAFFARREALCAAAFRSNTEVQTGAGFLEGLEGSCGGRSAVVKPRVHQDLILPVARTLSAVHYNQSIEFQAIIHRPPIHLPSISTWSFLHWTPGAGGTSLNIFKALSRHRAFRTFPRIARAPRARLLARKGRCCRPPIPRAQAALPSLAQLVPGGPVRAMRARLRHLSESQFGSSGVKTQTNFFWGVSDLSDSSCLEGV